MSWLDRYQPASFRGVAFKVDRHQFEFGRNKVTHEYPQRDSAYTEDLGRKVREYSISAYLVGSDYDLQRNKLIEAIEQAGPGELVHPYLGTMQVEARTATLTEESASGRFCVLSLSFVEAGVNKFPSAAIDNVTSVGATAEAVADQAVADFVKKFSIKGLPQFCIDSVRGKITNLTGKLETLGGPLLSASESAGFFRDLRSLAADVDTLVQSPELLGDKIKQNLMVFGGVSKSGMSAVRGILGLLGYGDDDDDVGTSTSTRSRQGNNHKALNRLVQELTVSAASQSAVISSVQAYDEAVEVRDEIVGGIDGLLQEASDPQFFELRDLQAKVSNAVPASDELPRLRPFTPLLTQPSLVLAHRLHGDAKRAGELVQLNRVRHPGFVTGGNTLQVLGDE